MRVWRRRDLLRAAAAASALLGGLRAGTSRAGTSRTTAGQARTILAAMPIARLDLPWWRDRHAAVLARLRQGDVDLLFLGDSITQDWELRGPPDWRDYAPIWDRFYGDRHAVNCGFAGDTTANLLWRLRNGEADGIAPKVAVVLIGANNLGRVHWSAADTLLGIDAILAELRRRLPHTKVLLLGILPSERSDWATRTTLAVNRALADRARLGHGGFAGDVTFLDPAPVFMAGGRLDRGLYADPLHVPPGAPLHPAAQGQRKLAMFMEPTLAGMLGDARHG